MTNTRTPLAIQLINMCQTTPVRHSVEAIVQALALATIKGNLDPERVISDVRDSMDHWTDLSDPAYDLDIEQGAN